jgi:hypothetical protein
VFRMSARIRQARFEPSIANVAVGIAALLGVWSTRYAWMTTGRGFGQDAARYYSDDIFLWACLAIFALACGRAAGLVDRSEFGLGIAALSLTAASSVVWLLAFMEGDDSSHLSSFTTSADPSFTTAAGLWMAIASCVLIGAFAAMHSFGWFGERLALGGASTSVRVVALCAVFIAASATMPWAGSFLSLRVGASYNRVLVQMVLAILVLLAAANAAAGELEGRKFGFVGAALGAASFGVSLWFLQDIVGSWDPAASDLLVQWFKAPVFHAAAGMYVSLYASAIMFVVASRQAIAGPELRPQGSEPSTNAPRALAPSE